MSVADEVRRLRHHAGLSQEALASLAQVSVSSIIRIERGETPRLSTLSAIAGALDVKVAALIDPPQEAIA